MRREIAVATLRSNERFVAKIELMQLPDIDFEQALIFALIVLQKTPVYKVKTPNWEQNNNINISLRVIKYLIEYLLSDSLSFFAKQLFLVVLHGPFSALE